MKQNTIENEIDFLYQQRQEIVKEKEYYLKELERINEKINVLEKDYYPLLNKYHIHKILSFLTFLLAFSTNNFINNKMHSGVYSNQKAIFETIELIIYIIPFIGSIDLYFQDEDLRNEIKRQKEELKKYYEEVKKNKHILKLLNYTDQDLESVISSKYALLMCFRKNDVKTLQK